MNVPIDVLCKTPETKAHSEKSMNVSVVQVSDEDVYLSRNMTIRANLNDDSQVAHKIAKERNLDTHFPVSPVNNNKIVKERIWINPVTSKIMKQSLEPDTDAQSHAPRVVSVRKQAESASRALHEKRPR